jgi:hypothetical protein
VVGVVENVRLQKLHFLCFEFANIFNNVMGFYKYLLTLLFKTVTPIPITTTPHSSILSPSTASYEALIKEMEEEGIEEKTSLSLTLLFMCTKLNSVFRFSPDLFKKIKLVTNTSKSVSINRSYYDLLTHFAMYLNSKECEFEANSKLCKYLQSFMTCPSPYIVEPRTTKSYSLVLDLDETLVNTKLNQSTDKSRYTIGYRPYCQEFVEHLSKYYEIIIFTSSVSAYAHEAISNFREHVSHVLCR